MNIKDLPKPECKYGYPREQLKDILGDKFNDFCEYSIGCTGVICEGKEYDRDKDAYVTSKCGPHGLIIYKTDVKTFLEGRLPLD